MYRYYLLITYLFLSGWIKSQNESYELDCLTNNQICDFIIENEDTTWKLCIDPYFPILSYLDYGEDCVELYMLFKYSLILKQIDEKILYNEAGNFIRILILKGKNSRLIFVKYENNLYNVIIKNFELDSVISPEKIKKINFSTVNYSLTENEFFEIEKHLLKSDIYAIKPHPVDYFSFSDLDILCFESKGYGGYTIADLYIPFTIRKRNFKGLFKFIEKIEMKSRSKQTTTLQ